jgi:hypothetical protein
MTDTATKLHREVLQILLEKVEADTYPSTTMLNTIEEMLRPEDVEAYAEVLLEKVRTSRYPSIPMLARVRAFT